MRAAEPLEPRLLFASARFAVIGDFGAVSPEAQDVADLVHRKDPEFIITVGDNNYPLGERSTLDGNVGRYYHDYIHPYSGKFGGGSPTGTNRFFPALGNHDYDSENGDPYVDYFTLPGNERYYTFTRGPVQFFAIDSDPRAPDLGYVDDDTSTAGSVQGRWLKRALRESAAQHRIVYFHHAPYSSGASHGSSRFMQWPFRKWGATAILAGHDHIYERFDKQGTPFFVNGLGGRSFRPFSDTPVGGSRARFTGGFGAMFVAAGRKRIVFKFITTYGDVIDRYEITAEPAAPTKPRAETVSSGIRFSWRDASANESFFKVQRSIGDGGFETLGRVEANVTSFLDAGAGAGTAYTYRVRAVNANGSSDWATAALSG
jgi:hypothetical protein